MNEEYLTCPKCKTTKVIDQFAKNKSKPKGRASWCKQCTTVLVKKWFESDTNRAKHKQRTVQRRVANKDRLIEYYGNKCLDCQQSFQPCCYDFHHLDGSTKEKSFGNMGSYSWENIEKEVIGKCVMLCSNCHRIRHHARLR